MFESIFGKIVLTTLIASALATTGVLTKDVVKSLYAAQIPKQGIDIQPTATLTPSPTIEITPTATPTEQPLVEKKTVTRGKCIITLFGVKYDVTDPNKKSVGGDIFNCGQDMTTIFKTKHGTDVSRMEMYLVDKPIVTATTAPIQNNQAMISSAPTATPTVIVSPTSTSKQTITATPTKASTYKYNEDSEERDDNEHKDRYVENREVEEDGE